MGMSLVVVFRFLVVFAVGVVGLWLLVKILMGLGWVLGHVFRGIGTGASRIGAFVSGMLTDTFRLVGGIITAAFFVPAICANVILGRWSRANHYGHALETEVVGVGSAAYRVALGHLAHLLGLKSLTDGFERRIPAALARAPGSDLPHGRSDAFDGYEVVGSLPSGGSGARLFLAEPGRAKREQYARAGQAVPEKVVIKSFSMADGSTMPQIVRESRALDSARRLGLVLEHELDGTRFHYVMPYVPGQDLSAVTQHLHAQAGPAGLDNRQVSKVLDHTSDLLKILERFHGHDLWHKDIKPSNIIVSEGRVHLVDLGLTTPLSSAMTLTTHGTEYFRDPELVRLALRGVKVNEVDGVKFDIYGVGAVLYSMIENSFPAHGSLSQIHKRCPEALRWITRKAMTDMSNRYGSAQEMLADVEAVMASRNPFKVKPAKLPSMQGGPRERPQPVNDAPAMEPVHPSPCGPFAGARHAARTARHAARRHMDDVRENGWAWASGGDAPRARKRGGWSTLRRCALALVIAATVFSAVDVADDGRLDLIDELRGGIVPANHHVEHDTARTPNLRRGGSLVLTTPMEVRLAGHRDEPSVLLILDDVPQRIQSTDGDAIESLYGRLETARFQLVGVGRAHDIDPLVAVDLEAQARAAIGLGSPRDPEVLERLNTFLEDHTELLDAVVWIGPDDTGDALAYEMATMQDVDHGDLVQLIDANP